jgi:hypothetical protein
MVGDKSKNGETDVQHAEALNEERRRELLRLFGILEDEATKLSRTHPEQADSIAGFAQVSAHEATRTDRNPSLLKPALEGLRASVQEFDASHPGLVQIVGAIITTLANMGV